MRSEFLRFAAVARPTFVPCARAFQFGSSPAFKDFRFGAPARGAA